MPEEVQHKCLKEECHIEADGKCFEGHKDFNDCPHYMAANQDLAKGVNVEVQEIDQKKSPDVVDLFSGKDITYQDASLITLKTLARVIVLAGAVKSGKTTFLASLYEKFLRGPIASYVFAGSLTLLGFERRCYLGRISSGKTKGDMERTKRGFDEKLLHLKVRIKDLSRPPQDLLFSDISGETFEMARDSTVECQQLNIIKRADHFVLVIDGEKLSRVEDRQSAYQNADMLFRRCIEAGMLVEYSFVDVLFTKYDLIKNDNEAENLAFLEDIKLNFKENFEKRIGRLDFYTVAARPERTNVPLFYGLDDIFPNWVEKSPFIGCTRPRPVVDFDSKRQFDRYIIKRLNLETNKL